MLHGTKSEAQVLVDVGLWEPVDTGWQIRNYAIRQELEVITEWKRRQQSMAAKRTNCVRWHGPDCGCWKSADPIA